MTQLFILSLASLFGRIQIDYSAHYSAPKRIFGTALVNTNRCLVNCNQILQHNIRHNDATHLGTVWQHVLNVMKFNFKILFR